MTATEPYGRWPSRLLAAEAASARISRSGLASDGRFLYWLEGRPSQGGIVVVARARPGGPVHTVSPGGANVRSRVHEYGGGAFTLVPPATAGSPSDQGPALAYVHLGDQRVRLSPLAGEDGGEEPATPDPPDAAGTPDRPDPAGTARTPAVDSFAPTGVPLTPIPPDGEQWNHGDLCPLPDGSSVLAVRERIAGGGVTHTIVGLDTADPGTGRTLVSGPDFVAAPRPDPTGQMLAWVCWNHPDMSWTSSELWVGDLQHAADGPVVVDARRLAGGPGVSVGQPTWSPGGSLLFVSDEGGWWQPWCWQPGSDPVRLCDASAEFHGPDWSLGQSTLVPLAGGAIVACRWRSAGTDRIGLVDVGTGRLTPVEQPAVTIGALCRHGSAVAWMGATPYAGPAIWVATEIELAANSATPAGGPANSATPAGVPANSATPAGVPANSATPAGVPANSATPAAADATAPGAVTLAVSPTGRQAHRADVSVGAHFSFENRHGQTVNGLYFAPTLGGVRGPATNRPPLVVQCHGGPTGAVEAGFDVIVQFFTTRGFAVAAVDYGGSTGYGRPYRDRLHGAWGVVDVEDCADAAAHLDDRALVDGRRSAIRGSSAGGLTALGALAQTDQFAAAVTWYGVTDLRALAASTHDFEARYCDWLVGALPEAGDEYDRRSPRWAADRIRGAVLLLQGTEDPIVPPEQARTMAAALDSRGVRCELVIFEGEGHGFRRAATIEQCLEAEHRFYLDVLVDRVG